MRILYITSGVNQLYPHRLIDESISTSLRNLSHEVMSFYLEKTREMTAELGELVEDFEPDYVFTIHGANLSHQMVDILKARGAIVGIWYIDDPYDVDESLERLYKFDLVFTNEESCVSLYQAKGFVSYYLPLGTIPEFYYPELPAEHYRSDLCIIGSPYPRRVELLRYLLDRLPAKWRANVKIVGPYWREFFRGRKEVVNRYVNCEEIRRFYNGAKINLNIYREPMEHIIPGYQVNTAGIPAVSANNRTYDIGACRAFQLSDQRAGLEQSFDLEKELIIFTDQESLLEKICYYLDRPKERKEIAKNLYWKVLRAHCFKNRLIEMVKRVKQLFKAEVNELVKPEILARGLLLKGRKPAVYLVYQNKKHLIPNEETFEYLNLSWNKVQLVEEQVLKSIVKGVPLEI